MANKLLHETERNGTGLWNEAAGRLPMCRIDCFPYAFPIDELGVAAGPESITISAHRDAVDGSFMDTFSFTPHLLRKRAVPSATGLRCFVHMIRISPLLRRRSGVASNSVFIRRKQIFQP
jgi:hypothetical protein